MPEPTTRPAIPVKSDSPPIPPRETSAYTFSIEDILFWEDTIPPINLPYNIDNIKASPNAYNELVTIAISARIQLEEFFSNAIPNIRLELEKYIASATSNMQPGTLQGALEIKSAINEIWLKARLSKSWSESGNFYGVDALSLDTVEGAHLFAAYVDALDGPHTGMTKIYYANFIRSLTADHVKRLLIEAMTILEEASAITDISIFIAQATTPGWGSTFKVPIERDIRLGSIAGAISIAPANNLTIYSAIQNGIALLKGLGESILSRATAVGIGALIYSPALGNGERYPQTLLSMPAGALLPQLPPNLHEAAVTAGTVELPYRIYGDHNEYKITATPTAGVVSAKVPVRMLVLDSKTNSYNFTSSDTLPINLSFPITRPTNNSTAFPAQPAEVPRYTGITLTPLLIQPETLPAAELPDFRDCIYCFPVESGLPPIYVVFNTPYKGANTKGKYSGRLYDPANAGGPTLSLDWTRAQITQGGIELVKLHTGRFGASDANTTMVKRLERILRGELKTTPIDQRFYTHEIRELERYRALGIADGATPEDKDTVWNNAHTATLEDFKLKDAFDLFYTPEAIEADDKQTQRETL
ncbi:S-type Pyocin [Pseudomonas tructae]|uniref:S-type Pyocin n=1 Tax=Pseudomonas tructae TaxID=2518644 RepID=A0A411MKP6_9PSED|nr:S-type pyocin domain-containing protein [Pseudomonas tructae]QBF27375.1 S-type Pyocin [Pseudomonas tructae]